jgi:hypothetical protein
MFTPLWQRIADGTEDLSRFTDQEILTGRIRMEDGRLLPEPHTYPEPWLREQVKRGLRQAQHKITKGAMDALDVYQEILEGGEGIEAKDQLKAGQFFLDRFLGKAPQHVVHHDADMDSAREALVARLLAARQALPPRAAAELAATGSITDDTVDAELVEDAMLHLEDLL